MIWGSWEGCSLIEQLNITLCSLIDTYIYGCASKLITGNVGVVQVTITSLCYKSRLNVTRRF